MNLTSADIAALKSPDVLHAYCRAALGAGKQVGRLTFYPCPYGAHSRPKLEVSERDGVGVAMCRACDRGGTVYDVAAGVLGLDARKDFPAVVQAVADAVGYVLRDDAAETPRKSHRKRKTGFSRPLGAVATPALSRTVEKPLEYLPPDEEAAALEAVRRAADNPARMAEYADLLGLPLDVLMFHTDIQEAAPFGLLGLDERGRLLYVYTHRPADGEPVRVVGVKTRNLPGAEPRFLMRGSKQMPWGWDSVDAAGLVFVTEGESDALAVRAALWAWLDDWAHNEPDTFPAADAWPVVVGKPDAGTFRDTWARRLVGKDVELIVDNDDAGRKGAEKTAGILRAAGVRRVFRWTPPAGVKDARAALDAARPWLLADDLMENRKEIHL
jgi:hypothetical protein